MYTSLEIKKAIFLDVPEVKNSLADHSLHELINKLLPLRGLEGEIALYALLAIEQFHSIFIYPQRGEELFNDEQLAQMLDQLITVEQFYAPLGGIVGYQTTLLDLIQQKHEGTFTYGHLLQVACIDTTQKSVKNYNALRSSLYALPQLGLIYPVGGLGDRLNFKDEFEKPLPVALLPFCGRPLLEGLIRDAEAQEYLYYKIFGKEITLPMALMTSDERGNHEYILSYLSKKNWFGRSADNFSLFTQPSVPSVTIEGRWSMRSPSALNLSPGGHGALWKVAQDKGIFDWFQERAKIHLLIRQINNPISGLDSTLLLLLGLGKEEQKTLGIASCQRVPAMAEGTLALVEKREEDRKCYALTNIEYTEMENYTFDPQSIHLPTNTNIVYLNLPKFLPKIRDHFLSGLMINMKSEVPFYTEKGEQRWEKGGRLESMMQSITELLMSHSIEELPLFITYGERRKTISTAKKAYVPGVSPFETPQFAFYDLMLNMRELFTSHCHVQTPEQPSFEEFIEKGPAFIALYHPALGPLYEIIAQKIRGGELKPGAELHLEISELDCEELILEGSLSIIAYSPLGEKKGCRLSPDSGKCTLKNVRVVNAGIDPEKSYHYWKNEISHRESLQITLAGNAEFYAKDVTLKGDLKIEVPTGERWRVLPPVDEEGELLWIKERIEAPSWCWHYSLSGEGSILLSRHESHPLLLESEELETNLIEV